MFIKRCYVLPAVHTALMWSPRSPLLLSNLDLQQAAFGPVFLCPHEGKHVSPNLHISVRFSCPLLPPDWMKVAHLENGNTEDVTCVSLSSLLLMSLPQKSQNDPTAADLLHHCDIHSCFPVTASKYFQQTGERVPGSLTHVASMSKVIFRPLSWTCRRFSQSFHVMGPFRLKERWIVGRDRRLRCFILSPVALRVWFGFVSTCKHVSWRRSPPPSP